MLTPRQTSGHVRLHRKLQLNPIWTQLSPAVFKVFVYFILQANWKPAKWYDGEKQIDIPIGSFITTYPSVVGHCNLSIKQVRDAFQDIQNLGIAAYSKAPRYTLVSLLNYGQYNLNEVEQGSQQGTIATLSRAVSGHDRGSQQGTIGAPVEEVKNINNKIPTTTVVRRPEKPAFFEGEDPLEQIQRWLRQYVEQFGFQWGNPDQGICLRVFQSMNGASLDRLEETLRGLYEKKQRPTKNYAWFISVIAGQFEVPNGARLSSQ